MRWHKREWACSAASRPCHPAPARARERPACRPAPSRPRPQPKRPTPTPGRRLLRRAHEEAGPGPGLIRRPADARQVGRPDLQAERQDGGVWALLGVGARVPCPCKEGRGSAPTPCPPGPPRARHQPQWRMPCRRGVARGFFRQDAPNRAQLPPTAPTGLIPSTLLLLANQADQEDTPESTYQATFDTPEDGGWATVRLPWHSFVPVKRAQSDPQGEPLTVGWPWPQSLFGRAAWPTDPPKPSQTRSGLDPNPAPTETKGRLHFQARPGAEPLRVQQDAKPGLPRWPVHARHRGRHQRLPRAAAPARAPLQRGRGAQRDHRGGHGCV